MIKPRLRICGVILLVLSSASLAGIVIHLEPDRPKYVLIKNPYDASKSYLFWYVKAQVNSRLVHFLDKTVFSDLPVAEKIEIYSESQLVSGFDNQSSTRLMSILKDGWTHPVSPSCPNVMLFIRYGLLMISYPAELVNTGATKLENAIEKELIRPGDVIVILSEADGFRHSCGLIYLGKYYFLSCENGTKGFYFRHASHIDQEREKFGRPPVIYRVNIQHQSHALDSGCSSPSHTNNTSETMLMYKAEFEKINALSPPSYIK